MRCLSFKVIQIELDFIFWKIFTSSCITDSYIHLLSLLQCIFTKTHTQQQNYNQNNLVIFQMVTRIETRAKRKRT